MDSLKENVFSDIERRLNNASSEQQTHTPFTKGTKLQKFSRHHQAPWQKDKNDDVQAQYLGAYPQRTCGTPIGSKIMEPFRWKKIVGCKFVKSFI